MIFLLLELVTSKGYPFRAESLVTIGEEYRPLDMLTGEQRDYVLVSRDVHALNAAYSGKAVFTAEGLPKYEKVFPESSAKSIQTKTDS